MLRSEFNEIIERGIEYDLNPQIELNLEQCIVEALREKCPSIAQEMDNNVLLNGIHNSHKKLYAIVGHIESQITDDPPTLA